MDNTEKKAKRPRIGAKPIAQSSTEGGRYEKIDYKPGQYAGNRYNDYGNAGGDQSTRHSFRSSSSYGGSSREEGGFQRYQNHNNNAGYRQQRQPSENGEYQPRRQGSYQPRSNSYTSRDNGDGGYQSRQTQGEGGYQRREYQGGYRSRDNYAPRESYNSRDNYSPRENYTPRENYMPRENYSARDNYAPRDNYQSRENYGGYERQQRYDGGNRYQQRGDDNGGGYQQRRPGGYQQRRPGGFAPRQGGYQQRQGGYQRRPGGQRPNNGFVQRPRRIEYEMPIPDINEQIRLNKFMANAGICSRREADEFIQQGLVKVNGKVVTELGTKITHSDTVEYDDKVVALENKCYILLNKPKDCVTTSDDPNGRLTVLDLVKGACDERIYPVGRLDRNTTGVLLLTNDGDLASKLTHPKYVKKKIYHVWCDHDITEEDLQHIADGVELEDGMIHADAISYANDKDRNQAGIEIHSGQNRIVRRIFEKLGYHVTKLDRVYFAGLTKKNLPRGRWRYLTQEEVNKLKRGAFE